MAIGKSTDFIIYQEQFFGGATEVLEQNANGFNAASANCIQLIPSRLKGDYEKESFMKAISGIVSRRDITSTATVTDLALTQGEAVAVKVAKKIGPVANTLDSLRKIASDPQEFSFILGQQWGKSMALDQINTSIAGVTAALTGVSALVNDVTSATTKTVTHNHLVNTIAKMGDAGNRIAAFVMHSKTYYDLLNQSISDKIFEVASTSVFNGTVASLGRPVIVTDAPALLVAGTPNTYRTLALVEGAVTVKDSEEREVVSDLVTGLENLVIRIQGEYAYNLGVKGFTWDTANGGANPADAAIATSSNWDKVATDNKSCAGAVLVSE